MNKNSKIEWKERLWEVCTADEPNLMHPLRSRKCERWVLPDIFDENVTDEMRDRIFAVMALSPHHTFQVLTKRPERMLQYLSPDNPRYTGRKVFNAVEKIDPERYTFDCDVYWPLDNVLLGLSVENQQAADKRIPLLLQTPAAVRFLSCEPLLGSINLKLQIDDGWYDTLSGREHEHTSIFCGLPKLGWVIVGGESGHKARPMHPDWARSLRDQCAAAGVPFFMKQMGSTYGLQKEEELPDDLNIRQFPEVPHA